MRVLETTRGSVFIERVAVYFRLFKPRLVFLVLVSCWAGFVLASDNKMDGMLMGHVLIGTFLTAAGTLGLNQWMERDFDKQMVRTAKRPIPSGELSEEKAFRYSLVTALCGMIYLLFFVHKIAACLGALTFLLYLGVYTPMKRWTSLCVYVGAIAGALPPLIGWSAAAPSLTLGAWALFLILTTWQIVHFSAIAWIYREDYKNAGFVLSEIKDATGKRTSRKVTVWTLLLCASSFLPFKLGLSGMAYLVSAALLGILLLALSMYSWRDMAGQARRLMFGSLLYLFVLFVMMTGDKI